MIYTLDTNILVYAADESFPLRAQYAITPPLNIRRFACVTQCYWNSLLL